MGCSKSSSKSEVHSDASMPQETRKISNKQPKIIRGKEIIKVRKEKNKIENKKKEKRSIKQVVF